MISYRQALKLLVVFTFAFAVVTIVRNIEYVKVLPDNRASRLVTLREVEEKPIFIGKSFDTAACAVPATFVNDSKGCKVPNVDPYNDYIMEALKPVRSITCPGRLYTEYKNNLFRLLDDVNEENQVAEIFAEPIYRVSDYNVLLGEKTFLNLTNKQANLDSDFLKVTVRLKDGSEETYFHASIVEITEVSQRRETHSSPLNIMILALDRTSAAHFQRMLPKTYAFLKEELNSIMFKSYSIVGPNTTPAMSAFLTGKSLSENCKFKEARKGVKNSSFVDEWPFIFKDLKRLGIATMWSEDQPNIGAFHLRLKGFKDQPTDHYGRILWYEWLRTTRQVRVCLSSQAQYKLQLQYLKSFMKSYPRKRKFGFTFLSDLCHRTANLLRAADNGFVAFFESLKNESLLNDTMFITMSDHGPTYKEIRYSPQGKLEHRLPFLSLTFPPWFKRNYPEHFAALGNNSQIISSPFDLYATMKHLLTFPHKRLVETTGIGASLFEPLPDNRTCEDTGITDNYCPCLRWKSIDLAHPHVHKAVKVAVIYINQLLLSHPKTANLCHQLELKTIFEAHQMLPRHETDRNFLSGKENVTCSYQIQFQTTPGDGLFEALLKMNATGDFKVDNGIDRVSMYGNQPKCIVDHVPSMRPFCLCK